MEPLNLQVLSDVHHILYMYMYIYFITCTLGTCVQCIYMYMRVLHTSRTCSEQFIINFPSLFIHIPLCSMEIDQTL